MFHKFSTSRHNSKPQRLCAFYSDTTRILDSDADMTEAYDADLVPRIKHELELVSSLSEAVQRDRVRLHELLWR